MSEKKKDGGPAFPYEAREPLDIALQANRVPQVIQYPGMTLRDWYKGQALIGEMLGAIFLASNGRPFVGVAEIVKSTAEIADAMIAEREKP